MGTSKSKTSTKERTVKSRKESGRTRLAPSTTSSSRSSRQTPLIHSRTPSANSAVTTASRGRSKSILGEDSQTRPTTAPEGRPPAFDSRSQSDAVPPLPQFLNHPPPFLRADTTPVGPALALTNSSESPLVRQVTFDNIINPPSSSSTEKHSAAEAAVFGGQQAQFARPPSPKEPAYKSKRPPPIASNLALPSNSQPSKSPSPSSARSLGRTLTEKLFGRRPSTGRRSMVRAALSDEPEPMPVPPLPASAALSTPETASIAARSPDSLFSAMGGPPPRPARPSEPLFTDLEPSRSRSPPLAVSEEAERDRQASLAALGGAGLGTSGAQTKTNPGSSENPNEQNSSDIRFDFGLGGSRTVDNALPTVSVERASFEDAQSASIQPERQEPRVESQRASLDSVSSYGSIGFTERTFSSRSSAPPADEARRKRSGTEPEVEEHGLAMPAPLRPRASDGAADSPTDPLFIDGRLSPIVGNDKDVAASTRSIDAQVEEKAEPSPAADQNYSSNSSDAGADDVADTVPTPLFRARKDSLASNQRPLFERPSAADIPVPALPAEPTTSPDEGQTSFRPRKDSLASVGGRRAVTKGTCRGCSKPILAMQKSVSSADGRLSGKYHKECFVCRTCREPFATAEFYVHEDQPYCGHHYHQLSDSLCATCGKGIEGLYMETANVAGRGKEKHHPACLKCATCRVQLTNDYFELSGKVYCERDAFRLASHPRVHSRGPARPSPLVREYIRSGDPGAIKGANFPERRTNRPMLLDVR